MRLHTTCAGEREEVSSDMPIKHAVTLTVTRYLMDVNHRAMGGRHLAEPQRSDLTNHMGTRSVSNGTASVRKKVTKEGERQGLQ